MKLELDSKEWKEGLMTPTEYEKYSAEDHH